MTSTYQFAMFETAIGLCGVVWGERGIVAVQLPQPDDMQTRKRIHQRYGAIGEATPPDDVAG